MTYIAYKYVKISGTLKERLHVKAFKSANLLGDFLAKQDGNLWKSNIETGEPVMTYLKVTVPEKTGVYASAGGNWHNVKTLDPCVLAHV